MPNILVFGDSIAFGDYDTEGGWVDRLKKDLLANSTNHNDDNYVYNLAVDSHTSSDMLKRLESDSKPRMWKGKETIFIFSLGINDAIVVSNGKERNKVSLSRFSTNLDRIVKLASKHSNKIVFIGPTPGDESKVNPMPWSPKESFRNNQIMKYNKTISNICKQNNILFINLISLLKNTNYINELDDGAHPNTKGHELIYKTVKKYLKKHKII
jgi:lysophospholipase L1-like esterase